jgi:hypothetical protein
MGKRYWRKNYGKSGTDLTGISVTMRHQTYGDTEEQMMTPRNRWLATGSALVAGALAIGLYLPSAVGAAGDPPTTAQAQAALNAITSAQSTLQAYLDAQATPTPTPTVTAGSLDPGNVSATVSGTTASVSWTAPAGGTPTGYTYGRDGVDSTGAGPWTSPSQSTTSATLDKLVPGTTYAVTVTALYAAGNHPVTISVSVPPASTATATVTPSATPTATSTSAAGANPSGLAWSSGVWTGQSASALASFVSGPRGGRPVDNVLVYTSRGSISAENNPTAWRSALPPDFNGTTQDLVLALTTWTSDGAFMTGAQAQTIGSSVCSVDGTAPIVRLDWEMNLADGAGSNGAELTASNFSAWVARFNAVAVGLKAGCPGLRIDFNPNHGGDQTPGCSSGSFASPNTCTRQAFQAVKANVEIYGLDTYDSYPPVTSSGSGWGARINPGNFGELENSRLYAVANGKKYSVPEWGEACNVAGCQWQGNAGGDDPVFAHDMLGFFVAHSGDMAYDTYFDEPASYIQSDLISQNPNSRAQYRSDILANVH